MDGDFNVIQQLLQERADYQLRKIVAEGICIYGKE